MGIAVGILTVAVKNRYYPAAPTALDVSLLEKNITELNSLNTDMSLFNQDDVVLGELIDTVNEVGEISNETVLFEEENNLTGISQDINNLTQDETLFEEINQTANESAI